MTACPVTAEIRCIELVPRHLGQRVALLHAAGDPARVVQGIADGRANGIVGERWQFKPPRNSAPYFCRPTPAVSPT